MTSSSLTTNNTTSALEAGFFAGAVFYLTLFYTRGELGFRIALFFGSALLAGAFSGLLAFGVFQIPDPHVHGWMWLFVIEGGMTVVLGVAAFFWLPATPSTAWFLTEDEKAVAAARHYRDGGSGPAGGEGGGEGFRLGDCFRTWGDPVFAVWCAISLTYPVAFSTTANFLPMILQRLGYSTVVTNLLTVPPNLVGFVVLLLVARSSDRHRERSLHIIGSLCLSLAGLIILAAVPPGHQGRGRRGGLPRVLHAVRRRLHPELPRPQLAQQQQPERDVARRDDGAARRAGEPGRDSVRCYVPDYVCASVCPDACCHGGV